MAQLISQLKLDLCQLKQISCEISPEKCWKTETNYLNKVSQLWSTINFANKRLVLPKDKKTAYLVENCKCKTGLLSGFCMIKIHD